MGERSFAERTVTAGRIILDTYLLSKVRGSALCN